VASRSIRTSIISEDTDPSWEFPESTVRDAADSEWRGDIS